MHYCKFCKQERKNLNSLVNHERLCKENPNRQFTTFQDLKFQRSEKKGKKNQWSNTEYIISDDTRIKLSNSQKNSKKWSPESRSIRNIGAAKTINKKVSEGTWHTSLARHMHIDYNGIDLHGSWELIYAKYLDLNKIKWKRNTDSFEYIYENKKRRYIPDFYLMNTDEYIEIKGYKTEKDSAKWDQFPKHRKLTVLMYKELKDMGLLR